MCIGLCVRVLLFVYVRVATSIALLLQVDANVPTPTGPTFNKSIKFKFEQNAIICSVSDHKFCELVARLPLVFASLS